MDYIVYLDSRANEMHRIQNGSKSMLMADITRMPQLPEELTTGDWLYLTGDGPQGKVELRCSVQRTELSTGTDRRESWLSTHQDKLQLTGRQWKRCLKKKKLLLVEIRDVQPIEPIGFNRMLFGHSEDWVPIGDIERAITLTKRK